MSVYHVYNFDVSTLLSVGGWELETRRIRRTSVGNKMVEWHLESLDGYVNVRLYMYLKKMGKRYI